MMSFLVLNKACAITNFLGPFPFVSVATARFCSCDVTSKSITALSSVWPIYMTGAFLGTEIAETHIDIRTWTSPWWRHQMEAFSALLAICAGNSPVTGEFPAQRPVTRSFDVLFDLRQNKQLSKQSWSWWFETPSRPLLRQRNVIIVWGVISRTFLTSTAVDIGVWMRKYIPQKLCGNGSCKPFLE